MFMEIDIDLINTIKILIINLQIKNTDKWIKNTWINLQK